MTVSNVTAAIEYTETLRKRAARQFALRTTMAIGFGVLMALAWTDGRWGWVILDIALGLYWSWRAEDSRAARDRHEATLMLLRSDGPR
jgi:hypothetical protein